MTRIAAEGISDPGRRRADLRAIAWIAAVGAISSAIFGWSIANPDNSRWVSVLQGVVNSLLVSLPIAWLETGAVRTRFGRMLRRLPFLLFILVKTLFYLAIIVPSIQGTRHVFALFSNQSIAFDAIFFEILTFAGVMSLAANIILSLGSLLGWSMLWRLLTGRYHRPRREERIFLSVDLRDSTGLAERLGDVRFHALLNSFFGDVTDGAADSGAEIYKYVGDEVILTWLPQRGLAEARCLRCPAAIQRHIARDRAIYLRRFGVVPTFRAALHIGEVIAGEVGDLRREIGYFGDTLNTLSRLAAAGKDLDADVLVSEAVLRRLDVPPTLPIRSLPALPMRGKSEPLAVAAYALPA